jgi:hypothetical protein
MLEPWTTLDDLVWHVTQMVDPAGIRPRDLYHVPGPRRWLRVMVTRYGLEKVACGWAVGTVPGATVAPALKWM